jgi:hypothetical protein
MATDTYSDATAAYGADRATYVETTRYRDRGGIAFIWIAWALAFAFWAFSMSTFLGIVSALTSGVPGGIEGGLDAGGGGVLLIDVIGVVALGAAIAWGAARWATRDKRLDPMTEASTAALYNSIERSDSGGAVGVSAQDRRSMDRGLDRPV